MSQLTKPLEHVLLEKQLDFHLEEYRSLKAEQLKRINVRDMTVYYSLVTVAAVFAAFDNSEEQYLLLLVVPLLGVLFGWIHIFNDQKIVDIGWYIGNKLKPRVAEILTLDVFEWDEQVMLPGKPASKLEKANRLVFFFVKQLCFVMPGAVALVLYITKSGQWHLGLCLEKWDFVVIFDVCCLILLASTLDRFLGFRGFVNE